jgi:PAS domain S-box-containing protein
MVEVLWREGNAAAAIRLEELWNELASQHPLSLLCAYSLSVFDGDESAAGIDAVCAAHHRVFPAQAYPTGDAESRREVSELQDRAAALETEIARRQRLERALRQSREELLDFVENAPVALRWVDADGRIIWANQAELDLVGHSRDEYVGRHISDFHVDSEVNRDVLERLGRNETLRDYPARLRRKDGSIRHVLIDSNVLWRDGAFVHTRCFTRDVTAQVEARAEQAARDWFRELFIGMLGHDLRNPLGAIATSAELLAMRGTRSDGERLDADGAKIVGRISRSAARMARMIDQVLDFAGLNAGTGIPLSPQPIDLSDVCAAVIDELQVLQPERTIEVKYIGCSSGCWDLDRLSQVLSNLIGNALAYGDPSEPVRILVTQDKDDVVVHVHNMGRPIPPEMIPTVFDPFRRARPKLTGDRGLGLGLYITKEIVRGHGGTIGVGSTAEKGTIFRVRLPRRFQEGTQPARPERPERSEVTASHAMPSARVLVVEDDEDSAEVVREVLVRLGHDVRVVRDGSLALTEAQRFEPDVVLLDLGLPTMDGVEVARRLRAITARARIVAMTGHGPAAASDVEFDAYLVKPVDIAALKRAMTPPAAVVEPESRASSRPVAMR